MCVAWRCGSRASRRRTTTWNIGVQSQTPGSGDFDLTQWKRARRGGGTQHQLVINQSASIDFTVTTLASSACDFDRTTGLIVIPGGTVGTPTSFTLYEIDVPTIVAPSATATSFTGCNSRPTAGGDSPQQPGGFTGTLSCNWAFAYR